MLYKQEQGFTLIEMLLSILIVIIIAHLILQTMLVIVPQNEKAKGINSREWELFLMNVKREIKSGESVRVSSNQLAILTSFPEKVSSIHRYNNLIRRQVDFKGHEVLLHNVKSLHVEQKDYYIKMTVIDVNDQIFSANLFYYNGLEG